jgi:hypothetical protein
MSTYEEIQNMLETCEHAIQEIQNEIDNFEIDLDDYEDSFCESLDSEGSVTVCGMEYMPSLILREVDPTAYRCGLIDYVDGIDLQDVEEYQELKENLEELEDELVGLQEEMEELEEDD